MKKSNLFSNIKKRIRNHIAPDISVIIPFHDVEDYISECLESVLRQKGVSIEIILVDDNSGDGSLEIIKQYMQKHNNMRLYYTDGKGPGAARNLGVLQAKGRYIAFLDADDVLIKGIYARMYNAAEHNDAEICICNVARFNNIRKYASDLHDKAFKDYKLITHITETFSLVYDTTVWNKLINRRFYLDNKISFPEGVVYEDIYINADMHEKCNRVVMISETGYLWRIRTTPGKESITQKFFSESNIRDRFSASKWMMEDFCNRDIPEGLKKEVQMKLLQTDLKIILDSVDHVDDERALQLMDEVKAFVCTYIDKDILESLPVIELQKYEYVLEGNLEGFRKLVKYRRENYEQAPVLEKNGKLYAELPDDIFTISKRTVNDDFARRQRRVWVDDIRCEDDALEIDAHIYIARYDMKNPSDQEIGILLINEETGRTLKVCTTPKETLFITKNRGTVEDTASGTITNYNYDYAGFSFRINPDIFDDQEQEKSLKYSVIAEYRDRLFSGTQIIKGISREGKEAGKKMRLVSDRYNIGISFGSMDELQITVRMAQ